jgi:hypothetical protein
MTSSTKYQYKSVDYDTLEEAQQAATEFKNVLETQPTTYCSVKRLGGDAENGWVVPAVELTDEEILNMSDGWYSIHSQLQGQTHMPLTAEQALEKVQLYKRLHAQFFFANKILTITHYETDEDMSGYF